MCIVLGIVQDTIISGSKVKHPQEIDNLFMKSKHLTTSHLISSTYTTVYD